MSVVAFGLTSGKIGIVRTETLRAFSQAEINQILDLLKVGVHPKVVSERLGHAGIGITLDTYSHVLPGMQEDAMRRLDLALGGAIRRCDERA